MDSHILFLIGIGFCAGFVDAVAGGGGLISLPAILTLGFPPQVALGTNKCIGIATASASSFRYWRSKNVRSDIFPIAIAAGIFAALGAWVATKTDPSVLRPIILIGLVLMGLYTLARRKLGLENLHPAKNWSNAFGIVAIIIGFYDGFFGPGTGTFLMMALVLMRGFQLVEASANARVINFATNLGAITLFASRGAVNATAIWPGAIASFIGGSLGAAWAVRHGPKAIRPVFILVTWLLIAKVAYDLLRAVDS